MRDDAEMGLYLVGPSGNFLGRVRVMVMGNKGKGKVRGWSWRGQNLNTFLTRALHCIALADSKLIGGLIAFIVHRIENKNDSLKIIDSLITFVSVAQYCTH